MCGRQSSDLHFTIEDQIAEGDTVATRYTFRGTQQGELMGIPLSNIFHTQAQLIGLSWYDTVR
ncbi:MAG: hypothetical protein NVSMB27_11180 [Ktedonobacteraceae bacterium]